MATTVVKTVFQFRRATTDEWEIVNPILREGEPAYDITAKKHKIGDGKSKWTDLLYQEGTGVADKIDWENILNAPTKLSQFENDIDVLDTSYVDEKLKQKADINHNHDGIYQPAGNYLTEETDPTVPEWAKQAVKPTYTYNEIENTPDLTSYAKIEYVNDEIEKVKLSGDKSLGIVGASTGQIAKIKSVDADGIPTEWEFADMPIGSGDIKSSTDVNKISIASDGTLEVNPINVDKLTQDDSLELILFGGNA